MLDAVLSVCNAAFRSYGPRANLGRALLEAKL